MKIQTNYNKPSFRGWEKENKEILAKRVASFSPSKRPEVIALINEIEKNSPNHDIIYKDCDDITARPKNSDYSRDKWFLLDKPFWRVYGIGSEFSKKSFVKVLSKMNDFLINDNASIPMRKASAEEYKKTLSEYIQKGEIKGSDKGLILSPVFIERFALKLVKDSEEPKGKENIEKFLEKFDELNGRARKTNVLIYGWAREIVVKHGNYSEHSARGEVNLYEELPVMSKYLEDIIKDQENYNKKMQKLREEMLLKKKQKAIEEAKIAEKQAKKEIRTEKIKKFFGLPTKQDIQDVSNQLNI